MNKNDKRLYKKINESIQIPKCCLDTIHSTLKDLPEKEKNHKTLNKLKLSLATTFCSIFLITGVVFAKDIKVFFQDMLNDHKGIISAIKNDFIETIPSSYIESNNVKVYIDSLLMDDYKLCISLSIEVPLEYAKKNIHRIYIPNIIIYDENNNILYQYARKEIDTSFFNNPKIDLYNFSYETSSDIGWATKNKNTYSFSYIINSSGFPKSKKINIKFDEINFIDKNLLDYDSNLSYIERMEKATLYTVSGKWLLNYDLSEKTFNRENYIYKIKNYNAYNYNFPSELIVSNTECSLEFSYNLKNILPNKDISINRNAVLKNQNNDEYYNKGEHQYNGDNVYCKYTFQLNTFDSTNNLQISIPLDNGENILLDLEKIK